MGYIAAAIVFFFVGWKLGRKYGEFQDIMLARRVARLVSQREQVQQDIKDFDHWERQDKRLRKVMEQKDVEEELAK